METKRYEFKTLTRRDFIRLLVEVLGYDKRELSYYEDGSKALIEFRKNRGCHFYVFNCAAGKFTGNLSAGEFNITHGGMFNDSRTRTRVNTMTLIKLGYLVEKAA
ncbi:MAG: hypothetical protein IJD85_05270 [Oscillospiraceae bacterium]|nr:hypothetical protein [Oscillospiraceae bacterium]